MRTHRSLIPTRPVGRAAARRWALRGALLTLAWLAFACPAFVYWQMSERPGGASLWDDRLWREGAVVALLAALAGWIVAFCLVGLVRWIVTGRGPSA